MKRVISLLLSIVIVLGAFQGLNFKSYAAEGSDYLSEDDIMWFTNKFLYTLSESEKAAYGNVLKKMSPDVEWSGDEYEKVKFCVDKMQGYWSKVSPFLPSTITDNEYVKLGNNLCGYFSCTIGVLKNVYYITNEDTNNIEKVYHYLKSFNSICSTLGWSLGPLSPVLSAVQATLPIAEILYSSVCTQSLSFYEADLQFAYWDPSKPELPTPEEASVKPAFQKYINDEKYTEGLNALYIKYSLMRMADEMKNITVSEPINEKGYFGGHTYQVFSTKFNSFDEAETFCEQQGGHLAVIESEAENEAVYKYLRNCGKMNAFLGIHEIEENVWVDVFGNVLNYYNWAQGEPNNGREIENVINFYDKYTDGKWNDSYWGGDRMYDFICEWDNYIDPYPTMNDEHHYAQTVIVPTCIIDGYTINRCSDCGLEYYSNNVAKLGHNYNFSRTVTPTCTAQGYDLYKCTRCTSTENRNKISAKGHSYSFTKTVAPTCTAQGYDLYICSVCNGTEKRNTVESTGHNYKVTSNTATCTDVGVKTTVCSKCGDIKTTDVSALGHSYNKVYTAPTCTEDGGYTNTCTRCGDITHDIYSALGHDYGECVGQDYISVMYNENGVLQNTGNTTKGQINEFTTNSAGIGNGTIFVQYPNEIRLDINSMSDVSDYKFRVRGNIFSSGNSTCGGIFAYDKTTGREPVNSAIPYTDKNGNLVNMKYIDYKVNGSWINGEYSLIDNKIENSDGAVICTDFSETRPHIVYTEDYALKNGIMNEDGTVNATIESVETLGVSFYMGIPGVYSVTVPTKPTSFSGNVISVFGYDKTMQNKIQSGVYNVQICFYHSSNPKVGELKYKIYETDKLISKAPATKSTDEEITYTCMDCGETHTDTCKLNIADFKIKTVSLSLESSITMNFKVLKSAVADFENPYVAFNCEGDELTVTDYTEQGDYYVFSYPGISPQLMNDDVRAVLHASHNGIEYTSPEKIMSVRTYAYTMLDRYSTNDYAKLRTLLVDLLNYGAASQKYVGYQTNNLVNSDLTDEQRSWGTNTTPTFENIRDYNYITIDNPISKWVSSGLVLNNSVMVRAKFTADAIENKTVKITCGKGEFIYSKDDFVKDKDGNYYVYCDEIFANEMGEEILLTVYDNGVQCSNTMRFSIESYAKLVHDSYNGTPLDELTTAMMRYGNSAKAYGA